MILATLGQDSLTTAIKFLTRLSNLYNSILLNVGCYFTFSMVLSVGNLMEALIRLRKFLSILSLMRVLFLIMNKY